MQLETYTANIHSHVVFTTLTNNENYFMQLLVEALTKFHTVSTKINQHQLTLKSTLFKVRLCSASYCHLSVCLSVCDAVAT